MSLPWMAWGGDATFAPRVLFVLIGAAVRGGILVLLATAVVRLWPRASAAQRHMVWAVACCSLLLLPILPLIVPVWHLPMLPRAAALVTATPGLDRIPATDQHPGSMAVGTIARAADRGIHKPVGQPLPAFPWLLMILIGWGSGTMVVLTVILESHRRVWRLTLEGMPLTDARMLSVLARASSTIRLAERVRVKLHGTAAPLVCGVLHPTIVLPVISQTWDEERLYHVFLHELAHIQRYDCLTQTVASLSCALYWCNPLVWLAMRKLRIEQERACDDVVLIGGSRPRGYATDLLELTQAFQPTGAMSLAALPFARPSELQMRMQSILESRHRSLVSRWRTLAVLGAGLGVMYPLVGLAPHARDAAMRPLTYPMENNHMKKFKQTAMVASAAAGLLAGAPAPIQAQQGAVTHQAQDSVSDNTAKQVDGDSYQTRSYHYDGYDWSGKSLVINKMVTARIREAEPVCRTNSQENCRPVMNVGLGTEFEKNDSSDDVPVIIEPGAPSIVLVDGKVRADRVFLLHGHRDTCHDITINAYKGNDGLIKKFGQGAKDGVIDIHDDCTPFTVPIP